MANSYNTTTKTNKNNRRNAANSSKTYQMKCNNCDWKSDTNQSRSTVKLSGDQHKISSRDANTRKTHRVELMNVANI